ncbi:hypothetical protein BaRGS_00007659 [Batillaria attramentaria]|uniref:EGF-like domain-containing protein n=1 Tax=Batillaria attramentaria TaxID=370345 RepID=A0ABD0LQ92_9CAEN
MDSKMESKAALSTKGDGAVRPSKKSRQGDSKPCCYNGGLCVLGSFCHCPENFYGRHCEFELKRKTCGHVPHGSWVKAGCNLCQCNDGHMACLPRAFEGCDDLPLKEEIDPWDYKDEMVVFAADDSSKSDYTSDGADYYDYYELENSKKAAAGRTSQNAVCLLLTLLVWWLAS